MSFLEMLTSALRSIRANLTRAALTLLGVLIGVGSVILLLGVGSGASAEVVSQIAGLGTNTITVSAGMSRGATSFQDLTVEVAEAITPDNAPDVIAVVPEVSTSATVAYGTVSTSATVIGTTPEYFSVTNSPLAQGTAFQAADAAGARQVCVLGADLAYDLFGADDAVGRQLMVGGAPFTVYGVMKVKDTTGGSSGNSSLVAPLTRVQRSLTGYGSLSSITLQAASTAVVEAAASEATYAIAEALRIDAADATFRVTTQEQLIETSTEATSSLSAMLAAIAAISLVVGGIGVTNIMLVTVSERTREIGIRKALGAPWAAIAGQFVIEASLLSLTGGLVGVAGAWGLSHIAILGTRPVISLASVWLALGVSVGIGVIFGGYPALRAAAMKPVDALRHE
ncbi:MAG: ABC transporter permease [Bifidobacteriaceae bacterium]|jgi:putative ABC transport system permease protein|nr:ABC transporter permease [Bifidobacteriaceae bacterium]